MLQSVYVTMMYAVSSSIFLTILMYTSTFPIDHVVGAVFSWTHKIL